MQDDVLTLLVGFGGVEAGLALFDQEPIPSTDADPLVRLDGSPRALLYDVRRPQPAPETKTEEVVVTWQGDVEQHILPRAGYAGLFDLPFWAGYEALSGFDGFASGLRDGCLTLEWWDAVLDGIRRELEESDALHGILCVCDATFGFGGLASTLLQELSDESKASRVTVLALPSRDDTLKLKLELFSATLAFGALVRDSNAVVPVRDDEFLRLGASVDLATRPFRTRACDFDRWTSLITRDRTLSLAELAAGHDRHSRVPLFDWGHDDDDDEPAPGGFVVDADVPGHPVGAVSLACAGRRAAPYLRRAAARVHCRLNAEARRAAAHFGTPPDDADVLYEALEDAADAYEETY